MRNFLHVQVMKIRMDNENTQVISKTTIEASGKDNEASLDKLAEYLERISIAIRTRGIAKQVASTYPNPIQQPEVEPKEENETDP